MDDKEKQQDAAIQACDDMAETLYYRLVDTVDCPHCRAGVVANLVANLALAARGEFGDFTLATTIGMVAEDATIIYHSLYGDDGEGDDASDAPAKPQAAPAPPPVDLPRGVH